MGFAVAGIDAPSGVLTMPSRGVWKLLATLATTSPPEEGARVTILCGSLELSGTVTARGVHTSIADIEIIGGADGWRRSVAMPTFRADNGVLLSDVVKALSLRVGESYVLEAGAERRVGYAWNVAEGPAATALEDLTGGAWWMDAPGVTHIGQRAAGTRITAPWSVVRYMAAGLLVFSSPDDDYAAFPIGGELGGEALDRPFVIGAYELRWAASRARVSAWRR